MEEGGWEELRTVPSTTTSFYPMGKLRNEAMCLKSQALSGMQLGFGPSLV